MDSTRYEIFHEAKTHTSHDFPYNTYVCAIPLDFHYVPIHWHEEMEIIVIKKGAGIVTVNLVPYDVAAGDCVFILPGQLHSISQKEYLIMEYENILFRPAMLKAVGEDYCNNEFFHPLFSGLMDFPPLITDQVPYYTDIRNAIDTVDQLCDRRPYGYQLAIKGYWFQIFFTLFTNHPTKKYSPEQKKSLEKVKLILSYIQENYSRQITIEEIAQVCYYSKSHFMKFFKNTMGMGFTQYLNDYRLELAGQMLLSTSDSILDIASRTGFDNLSYFNRMFKRKYGVTPGNYRK
ncbi:MAG: AraC family transcriptional regulator [Ruminococcus sp.]|nr:AraC family transcriptional regulator [Ruminococcus sp.]